MDKAQLTAKIAKCSADIDAIFKRADDEKRPLTAEERAEIGRIEADADTAAASLKQLADDEALRLRHGARKASLAETAGRQTAAATIIRTDDQGRPTSFIEETDEAVTVQLGTDQNARDPLSYRRQMRADWRKLRQAGYKPCGQGGQFASFPQFIRAGFDGQHTAGFRDRMHQQFAAIQGMSELVGSDGGYLVMPEFAAGIIDRVYANDLWSRTDNYTVTGNNMTFMANAETSRANGSRHGGLRGYWLAEGAALTKSSPTVREVSLKLMKLGVLVYLTNELIDDAGTALQQYITRKAGEEFNFMIGDALINGTGVGQPTGILNAPSLLSIAKETGQAASTLVPENIHKMYARFFGPNVGNMVWLHNQDIRPQLNLMSFAVGTGGEPVFMPGNSLANAPHGSLLGRPLVPTEFNATLGTQGDLIAADLGQILSISKGGIAQAASIHVEFLTDQLVLRFIMRLNAAPWENAVITPFKGTNTLSNFLTLDTRA